MIRIDSDLAQTLIGIELGLNWLCNPVQDINGNWFISKTEAIALGIKGAESVFSYSYEDGNVFYIYPSYDLFNNPKNVGTILCYLIPPLLAESITEKQYGSYYLPKVLDMNGNIIAPIWIAYDDNFMEIWVELRSLEKIKYKPQV